MHVVIATDGSSNRGTGPVEAAVALGVPVFALGVFPVDYQAEAFLEAQLLDVGRQGTSRSSTVSWAR